MCNISQCVPLVVNVFLRVRVYRYNYYLLHGGEPYEIV